MRHYRDTSTLKFQVLEPRIMFDGAAVFTGAEALEQLENQNTSQIQNDINENNSVEILLKNKDTKKEIVFIDKGVDDYQKIVNSIDVSKSIYLIDTQENGFEKIQDVLSNQTDVDAIHIVGHANVGQVVLGNSVLNAETINSFKSNLESIGESLTKDGDILFYGCNLAKGEQGKLFVQQIGNITQADIAASDDITGESGDWLLEVEKGIIEAKSLEVNHYDSSLVSLTGVTSSSGFVVESGTNLRAGQSASNTASSASDHTDGNKPYVIAYEREITSGTLTSFNQSITGNGFEESNSGVDTAGPDISQNRTSFTASSSAPINSYLIYASESSGRTTVRSITFDGEIKGIWFNMENIIAYSGVDKSGATYQTISEHGSGSQNAFSTEKLKTNWGTNITINSKPMDGSQKYKNDWFGVDTDSNTLYVGFNNNAKHGDTIRVFTQASNTAPTAVNDTDAVDAGSTVNKTGSGDGADDVLNDDSDSDGDTITVTQIRHSSTSNSAVSSSSTYNSSGTTVTGTYGQLTIGADGSYTYSANQSAADNLAAGETDDDVFTYTISDGTATATATLTITVTGINEAPDAVDDTDTVAEDATVTKTGSQNDVLNDDTDVDNSASLSVTQIKKSGGSNSAVSSSTTYSNGTSVTGTYGTLTIGADGSYTYTADQTAADALDVGDSETDTFVYTVSDGTDTDTANLVITVTGVNDTPSAQNDVGVIDEGETLTVTNGANANVSGSYDADEEHSGDLIDTSSSSHQDSDPDASPTLRISAIQPSGGSSSSVSSGSSYNSSGTSVTGAYGTLTIGADGSYKYAANDSISGFDANETLTDTFTYTLSDEHDATDTATLTITLKGQDNEAPSATDNTNAVNEDATVTVTNGTSGVTGDVLINDTDPESDTLTVTKIKKNGGSDSNVSSGSAYDSSGTSVTGAYGTLTIGADGSYTYVADHADADALDLNDEVTDVFVYTVSDGNGGTDTANITITVTGINDDPVAVNDTDSVNEDASVTRTGAQEDVLNDDTDADDSASLTVSKIRPNGGSDSNVTANSTHDGTNSTAPTSVTGTYGTLKIGADGSYIYTADQDAADDLDAGDTATDVFVYTATDGTTPVTATLTITVTGVNDAPVAVNDTDSVNEDETVTKTGSEDDVMNDDSDADDDDSFTVTKIRKNGGSDSNVSSGSTYNSSGTSVTGTYGTLTIGADGSYTYVADQAAADALDAGDTETDVFVYTIDDGDATDTATLTITVTGVNDTPTAQNDVGVILEDETLTVANGANANVSGSFDATGEHSGDVLDTSSSSHKDSDLDDSASLRVSQIKKNNGSNSTVNDNTTYNGTGSSAGTSVTGTYGTLTIGSDGSYKYVADQAAADNIAANESADDIFVYTMTDGTENVTANITITVLGENEATITAQNDVGVVNEGSTLTVQNGANANVSGSFDVNGENSGDVINTTSSSHKDTDLDTSDTLSVTQIKKSGGTNSAVSAGSSYNSSGRSVAGSYGTLTIGADGSYTYVANSNIAGLNDGDTVTDTFVYTVSDGNVSDTANIEFTIIGGAATNNNPVAVNDTDSVNEDASVTKTGSQNDLLNDDSDADGDSISVDQIQHSAGSASAVNSGSTYDTNFTSVTGTYGTLKIGADGSYTYVADQDAADALDAGDTETDVFTYRITDGTATDTATLTITVTGINDDPVAVNDTDSVNEDATVIKTASQDDVINDDTDADDSASLTVTNISHTNGNSGSVASSSTHLSNGREIVGTYGTLTIGADGSYKYIADQSAADDLDAGDTATDVFTYTLSDGTATDTATLTITVTGVNDAPVAVNDTDSVNEDATVSKSASEDHVMNDDTDADDDDSFVVDKIRKNGGSDSAVSSGTTSANGTSVTGTYGTLTIGADGSYTYTADQAAADDLDAGDTATDVFVYTIDDGDDEATATLTITVTGVNDDPVAVNDTDSVNEDATVSKTASQDDVLNDDTDADDSASLTVSAVRTGAEDGTGNSGTVGSALTGTYGTLTLNSNGSYSYTADQAAADDLDAGDTATDIFTYTLSDGSATDTATLTITVTGINDDPVAVNDTDSVNEDATVIKTGSQDDVMNDDTDADDDDSFTVTKIRKDGGSDSNVSSSSTYDSSGTSVTGTYGTLTIGADGSYKYIADQSATDALDAGDTVTDVFIYTIDDGDATDTANITITVTGVNDDPVAVNDTDSVNEDETVTKTGAQDDLLNDDTDADDSSSLSVTNISHTNGNSETVTSSSTYESNGTQIVGTYGTLTVGADGSYTYTADQDAADSIANGSSETDVFTYTVSDGSATDTATITITVNGADNEVAGVNDTGAVDDDSTLSVGNQSAGVLSNDTDNGSAALSVGEASVSAIRTGRENASGTDGTIGSAIDGTYGSLTLNSDGTYDYTANTDAAEALAPTQTAVDYFTYTISDGTSTDTAELQITVTGINDAPTSSTPATIFATENQSVTIQTKTFFSDPDPSSNSYGQLTYSVNGLPAGLSINSNGKVTGIVTQGTYTFTVTATDGGNLSTQQTFTLEVAKSNDVEAVPEKLKINKKNIEKKVKNKTVVFKERSVVEVANLEVAKNYSFNGGMRVVDVAVEDLSNTNSDDPTPMSKSFLNEGTILGFAIGDDYRINVKQYTATMDNGSAVPDWVKVDPKTGQTLVQFPDNIYSIDIKIIAIDKDNTTREIDVTLDQSSIKPDKSLKRSLENFIDRSATLKSEVFIDNNGKMQLNALNKNQIDLNRTANLNNSEIVDIENNSNNNSILSTLKLASIDKNLDKITVKIADDKRNQVVKYSLSIPEQGLTLGNQIPNWLKINAETGEIEATPPKDLDKIKLQIIAEDEDGTLRTLEVDLDLSSNDQSKLPSKTVIDRELEKFASLKDQIHVKYNDYENYGDKIVKITS